MAVEFVPRSRIPWLEATRLGVALFVLVAVGAACGGDSDEVTPTPAETDSPTAAATPTSRPEATATATPSGPLKVPSLVQLVDAETGARTTLFEDLKGRAFDSRFAGDRVIVDTVVDADASEAEFKTFVFDLDGNPLDEEPPAVERPQECADINGTERCGSVSPDGNWILNHRNTRPLTLPSGYVTDETDVWIVSLVTGAEFEALEGYVHCGGCDGIYGPRWSPDSRYVVFVETGGDQRRFLVDLRGGLTEQIGTGGSVSMAPRWSPDSRYLVYPGYYQGPALMRDVVRGTTTQLGIAWPVAFTDDGSSMYSPAWAPDRKATGLVTSVVEVPSERLEYSMPGVPSWTNSWTGETALRMTPIGLVAALQGADGCEGTAIYVDGVRRDCVDAGVIGEISSTGGVAVARHVATRGEATGPGFATIAIDEYEVLLVDPHGTTRVVSAGLYGLDNPPFLGWNDTGTRLLIRQPYSVGI